MNRENLRVQYAPSVNQVTIGGALWDEPKLVTVTSRKGSDFHILKLKVASWGVAYGARYKLFIAVSLIHAAEYWHAKLHRGDVLVVYGRLRSRQWQPPDGGRKITFYEVVANEITLLYGPPPGAPRNNMPPEMEDYEVELEE